MIHASIFTLIIALAVGLAAIAVATVTYAQFRTRHLRAHLYLVTSVNLIVLTYVATLYFFQNLLPVVSPAVSSLVDNINQILIPGLQVTALASLFYFARLMLGEKASNGFFRSYGYVIITVVVTQVTLTVWQPYVSDTPVLYVTFRGFEILTLLGAYVILTTLFVGAREIRPAKKGRSLRIYASLLLGLLSVVLLSDAAEFFNLITPSLHVLVGAIAVLAANLIPILYRRLFFAPGFGVAGGQIYVKTAEVDLKFEFDISAREEEVLGLICEGRTNQEIADILYISLQTVKDHTSRIYRKVGVKNRVQLVTFLKDYGSTES